MLVYIYDGTFDGMLTAIAEAFAQKQIPDIIVSEKKYLPGIFDEQIYVTKGSGDKKNVSRFMDSISLKMPPKGFHNILCCYLSGFDNIEKTIFDYILLTKKYGKKVDNNLSNDTIIKIVKTARKVGWEAYRLRGLIRFYPLKDGVNYAPIEPDFNVIPLMAPHFKKRYSNQKWMIHDTRRNTAIYFDGNEVNEVYIEKSPDVIDKETNQNVLDADEEFYQTLWKIFYKNIAIKERKNLKLQMRFMPKKYWKYLVEKKE